jgi:hypothetical protein
VGAVAQWNQSEGGAGTNGHVAIVTAVNSNGTVNIEEYNYATKGGYGTRNGITAPRYLHIADQATPPQPPSASSANLLSNASFEMGSFKNWDKFPDGFIDYQSTGDSTAKEGGGIGRVQTTVAGRSFAQDVGVAPQPGQSYTFSMWVKSTTSTPFKGTIALWEMSGATGIAKGDTSFTVGSDWTLVSAPLAVTTAGTGLRAQIYLGSTGYDLALDGGSLASGNAAGSAKRSVPGLPTIGSATPGNSQVTLSWTAPTTDGGSPITGYVVTPYIGATAQAARTFNSTATTQSITGLANGTTYTFKVAAKNSVGTGTQSSASNAITPKTVPGVPLIGMATPGNAHATLTWTAPASNGGSPITGYVVTPYVGATAQAAKAFNSTATTQVITGLTNGTSYTFKVAAKNAVGTGAQSAASNAVTPAAPSNPAAPFVSWDAFVAQQFLDFTGDPGTTASRAAAVTQLSNGSITPEAFISQQMNNPSYGPTLASTARLYWAYLGRTPDYSGLMFWTNRRRAGWTLSRISQSFATSSEFTRKYGTLSNRAFVLRIYTDVLGRSADPSGVDYWTRKLDGGTSRGQVMINFSESSEYQRKMTGKINVVMVWAGMLNKMPTSTELATWEPAEVSATIGHIRLSAAYANRVT